MGKWKERAKAAEDRIHAMCADLEWNIKERNRLIDIIDGMEKSWSSPEDVADLHNQIEMAEKEICRLQEVETKLEHADRENKRRSVELDQLRLALNEHQSMPAHPWGRAGLIRDLIDIATDIGRAQDSAVFLALGRRARRLLGLGEFRTAPVPPACGSGEYCTDALCTGHLQQPGEFDNGQ